MSNELSIPVGDKQQTFERFASSDITSSKLLNDVTMDNFKSITRTPDNNLKGLPEIAFVSSEAQIKNPSIEKDPEAEAKKSTKDSEVKNGIVIPEKDPFVLETRPSEKKNLSFTPNGDVLNINNELCESGKKLVTGDCFTESAGKSEIQDQILKTPSGEKLVVRNSKYGDNTISGFIIMDKDGKPAKPDGTMEVEGKVITTYNNGSYSYTEDGITTIIFKDGAKAQIVGGKIVQVNRSAYPN